MDSVSVWASPASATPVEAAAYPADPGRVPGASSDWSAYAMHFLGLSRDDDTVTHARALAYSAVWGCVRVITQSLCSVGWHAYERSPDGRRRTPIENNEAWLIDFQANPEMSAFSWREVMLQHAIIWGNAFSEIERRGDGRPNWLWPLPPDRTSLVRDPDDGSLWVVVVDERGQVLSTVPYRDTFHVKGMGPDGLVGYSVLELASRTISLGLDAEGFGAKFFSRGPMPGGVVTVPGTMKLEQRREFRRSFEEAYSGRRNAARVVVLSDGTTFGPWSMPNTDAQFLESRTFQVQEVCRWFGVPPHKLADLARATFSNVEEQERAYVTDCALPWARRLETEADIKLFGPVSRGRRFTRLNLDALMRGNSTTQTDTVTKKVNSGLLTVNEARDYFELNPIEGGDTPLIQGAMVPLEQVVSPPEPEPAPEPAPAPPPPPPGEGPDEEDQPDQPDTAAARAVFGGLLADAYRSMLRTERDKAASAQRKGHLAEHAASYYDGAAVGLIGSKLRPVFAGLLLALGRPADGADALAAAAAARHAAKSRQALESLGRAAASALEQGGGVGEGWDARASAQAEDDIREVLG